LAGRGCDVLIKLELINQVQSEQEVVALVGIALTRYFFLGAKWVTMFDVIPAEFRTANHVGPQVVLGREREFFSRISLAMPAFTNEFFRSAAATIQVNDVIRIAIVAEVFATNIEAQLVCRLEGAL
jgi:hypothetical protein